MPVRSYETIGGFFFIHLSTLQAQHNSVFEVEANKSPLRVERAFSKCSSPALIADPRDNNFEP